MTKSEQLLMLMRITVNALCKKQFITLPELWLQKTFPGVTFANSNTPDHRYKMFHTEKENLELDDESKDVFKRNMLDRYINRPNSTFANGIYSVLDQFLLC